MLNAPLTTFPNQIAAALADDLPVAAPPTTVTTGRFDTVTPVALVPGTARGGVEVSALARARILEQQRVLQERGYSLPKMLGEGGVTAWDGLAIGTRVLAVGDENFLASRSEWEAMPLTGVALEQLATTVEAEGRQHVTDVRLDSLLVRPTDGALALKNGRWHVVAPTDTALRHLGGFLHDSSGLASYLPRAPLAVRKAVADTYRPLVPPGKLVSLGLKTKVPPAKMHAYVPVSDFVGNPRSAYAADAVTCYRVAGPKYAPYEVDRAARDILKGGALRDARCEVIYDGETARIRAIWHADTIVDLAAGDTFKAGVELSLDDVRGGAVTGRGIAWRNGCLNLIVIEQQTKSVLAKRHVGKVATIADAVEAAVAGVRADFALFVESWGRARKTRILDSFDGSPRRVFEGLVGAGLVDLPGRREEQVELLLTAFGREEGNTLADVVNAVTRAAHEGAWWNHVGEEEVAEKAAGKLLYVKNLVGRIEAGLDVFNKATGTVDFN